MSTAEHDKLVETVNIALDEIRPFLKQDGGDVELVDVSETVVTVRLVGNCRTCHVRSSTLKLGIEGTIRQHLPQIKEVVNIE